jgi:hypothetical protein
MSGNIVPFFTTINAAPGVRVVSTINSDFEGVYNISIDSDYVVGLIQQAVQNLGGLSEQQRLDLAKIAEIYDAVGLSAPGVVVEPPINDSETPEIRVTMNSARTTQTVVMKIEIITNNNDVAMSKRVSLGANADVFEMLNYIQAIILRNELAKKYLSKLYRKTNNVVSFDWKPTYTRFKLNLTVESSNLDDGLQIVVIQKK